MRPPLIAAALAVCLWVGDNLLAADTTSLKFEAQLVWATNDKASPDPHHKPVGADLKKRLKELPLKWSNYFEVNRKPVEVTAAAPKKVALSDKCDIEVKSLGSGNIEVSLFGKGEKVVKRTQSLPKGEILVVGGNAPNETAWLVVVKRVE